MANTPVCPYCNNPSELVCGLDIFPTLLDLADKKFYRCQPCKAHVGCHPDTEIPLGRLADAPLRKAKSLAHAAFDPFWQSRSMARIHAYRLLARKLGIAESECHIGMFDLETCNAVVRICEKGLK
jgi:arylsulfatase A-like enzyme